MRDRYEEIQQAGGAVLAVGMSKPAVIATHLRANPLPFPLVADPDRESYRAFGLGRTRWRSFLRPGVVGKYLRILLRGKLPARPHAEEDLLQLGGDFILTPDRQIVYAYRSRDATDRPPVEDLIRALGP